MGRDGGLGSAQIWTTGGPHSLGNQSIKASTGGWWAWAEAHPCLPQGTRHAWRLPLFASSSPPASDSHCSTPAHSHAHTLLCARGSCRTCSHSHAPSPSQLSTLLPDPASSPPTPSACLRPPFTHQANSMSIYYANFCASPHIPDSSRWGLGEQGRGTQRPAGVGPRQEKLPVFSSHMLCKHLDPRTTTLSPELLMQGGRLGNMRTQAWVGGQSTEPQVSQTPLYTQKLPLGP